MRGPGDAPGLVAIKNSTSSAPRGSGCSSLNGISAISNTHLAIASLPSASITRCASWPAACCLLADNALAWVCHASAVSWSACSNASRWSEPPASASSSPRNEVSSSGSSSAGTRCLRDRSCSALSRSSVVLRRSGSSSIDSAKRAVSACASSSCISADCSISRRLSVAPVVSRSSLASATKRASWSLCVSQPAASSLALSMIKAALASVLCVASSSLNSLMPGFRLSSSAIW